MSPNPKHFSNEKESIKLLEERIIPYVKAERGKLGLEQTRPALLTLNGFIDVRLQLTILKPLHASWIIQLYDEMTSEEDGRVILKGWEKAGISDGVKMGLSNLPPLDPFQQIFPLDSLPNLTCQPIAPPIDRWHEGRTVYESDKSGSEWEEEGSEIRNFLDAFDNEDFE